jgi:type 1 glutamine amidotransferase
MRVLVICDDYWHPGIVPHEGLAPLAKSGFEFDFVDDGDKWSAAKMAEYPAVAMVKSNNVTQADKRAWVTPEVETAFRDYAQRGGGILFIHSGTVYKDFPTMRGVIGGAFTHHPPQCPVTVEPKAGHPLTAKSEPFTLKDEHYHMELDDPAADVFLTTTSEHGSQPGGWTRSEGEGRIAVLTPGHNVEVWLHPSFQALLANALRWCAKQG